VPKEEEVYPSVKFTKMQGVGNDFVLIESDDNGADWTAIATRLCDRHYGIGADGLLVMIPSKIADFGMRIFNADGSEPEICGNGLRCMVRYYSGKDTGKTADRVIVETRAGILEAKLVIIDKEKPDIQVSMGKPVFVEKNIPVKTGQCIVDIKQMLCCTITAGTMKLKINPVSMGNPHAVHFTENPVSEFPLAMTGPEVAASEIFPEGTNFEVARVIDVKHIEARVWERGVGETLACGSGACAIAVASMIHGYTDNRVGIELPGGILTVEWDGEGDVFLSGPAEIVFTGEWLG
jgi:diaminopimelate epimerase